MCFPTAWEKLKVRWIIASILVVSFSDYRVILLLLETVSIHLLPGVTQLNSQLSSVEIFFDWIKFLSRFLHPAWPDMGLVIKSKDHLWIPLQSQWKANLVFLSMSWCWILWHGLQWIPVSTAHGLNEPRQQYAFFWVIGSMFYANQQESCIVGFAVQVICVIKNEKKLKANFFFPSWYKYVSGSICVSLWGTSELKKVWGLHKRTLDCRSELR